MIPKLPDGVKGQVVRPKSKVTVVNEKNRIVRYDDILSDSDFSPKAVESRSRQQYKDAFSQNKIQAMNAQFQLQKVRKTQKQYQHELERLLQKKAPERLI